MRVALVHDWLTGMRGGERVLEAFLDIYPKADIFSLIHIPGSTSSKIDRNVRGTSFLNHFPFIDRTYRFALPLYPFAVRTLDLSGYNLVVSLSHAAAKNVTVPREATHLSYCFSPMRYIWDQAHAYFGPLTPILQLELGRLRRWDVKGSEGVDHFIGISRFVAARIRKYYQRRASVIYPPVRTDWIAPCRPDTPGEAFLYAGALVPYKRAGVVIEAFKDLPFRLWIAGEGPQRKALQRTASSNVEFFGRVEDKDLAEMYLRCRALVFPGREDFGLVPVECLAAGRPVIALYEGGVRESILGMKPWENHGINPANPSGVFFRGGEHNIVGSLRTAVEYFVAREERFRSIFCTQQAGQFSFEVFERRWNAEVSRLLESSSGNL